MTSYSSMSAVGYRFHPTDEELVNHYLKQKMLGNDHLVSEISEVTICNYDPWELPGWSSQTKSDDPVWYFFCLRKHKYANSHRTDRTTKSGYWKVTGKDREIRTESTNEKIGIKKTLVFYQGRVPNGVRTQWIMHEYSATNFSFSKQRDYVVCKLKNKSDDDVPPPEEGESSSMMPWYSKDDAAEEDPQLRAHLESFCGYSEEDYNLDSAIPSQPYTGDASSYGFYPNASQFPGSHPFNRYY